MRYYPYRSIAEFLSLAHVGIINATRAGEVADILTAHGFGAAKLDEGAAMLATARDLDAVKNREYGEQMGATQEMQTAWRTADKTYAVHRKLARLALRDDEQAQVALLLNERKSPLLRNWLVQAEIFYANALDNAEILAAMGQYNVTAGALVEGKTAVSQVAHLRAVQQQRKAIARQTTKRRDDALDALYAWHRVFRTIAKIALDGDQRLESLGLKIVVK